MILAPIGANAGHDWLSWASCLTNNVEQQLAKPKNEFALMRFADLCLLA